MADDQIKVDIKVNKELINANDGSFHSGRVTFSSSVTLMDGHEVPEDLMEILPKINLSRNGTNEDCWFSLDSLSSHDGHAPTFNSPISMAEYEERITSELNKATELADSQAVDYFKDKPNP